MKGVKGDVQFLSLSDLSARFLAGWPIPGRRRCHMVAKRAGVPFGLLTFLYVSVVGCLAVAQGEGAPQGNADLSLEAVMDGVEERHAGIGFSAGFEQASTIKAMGITDTASGEIIVKRPGKMRWVYDRPERQIIVTDGTALWVYKPDDNQVMVGSFPTFFGDGKGASFLSDMALVRKKFKIDLQGRDDSGDYALVLTPERKELEIASVVLLVSHEDFRVLSITTYNMDGDETRIDLKNTHFHDHLADAQFTFQIPEGTEILQLE